MIGELPTSLEINGNTYPIRTNVKDILRIMEAYSDPNLDDSDRIYITMTIIYEDLDRIPTEDYEEALKKAMAFINFSDAEEESKPHPKVMDWVQDEKLIFPEINKVAGCETRLQPYIHWWTFLGYYMAIDTEGTYAQILSLRSRKAKGQKLEKWEEKYWKENRDICVIKTKHSEEQKAEMDALNDLINKSLGEN